MMLLMALCLMYRRRRNLYRYQSKLKIFKQKKILKLNNYIRVDTGLTIIWRENEDFFCCC